jgi:hypothetical protein
MVRRCARRSASSTLVRPSRARQFQLERPRRCQRRDELSMRIPRRASRIILTFFQVAPEVRKALCNFDWPTRFALFRAKKLQRVQRHEMPRTNIHRRQPSLGHQLRNPLLRNPEKSGDVTLRNQRTMLVVSVNELSQHSSLPHALPGEIQQLHLPYCCFHRSHCPKTLAQRQARARNRRASTPSTLHCHAGC